MEDPILNNIISFISKEERYNLFKIVDELLPGNYYKKAKALEVKQSAYYQYKKKYLFCWDDIPKRRNENKKLKQFLKNVDWVKTAKIEKLDDNIIRVSKRIIRNVNWISLVLNDKKTKVNININNLRTDELLVEKEEGKLKIYKKNLMISDVKTMLMLNLLCDKDKQKFTDFLFPIVTRVKSQFSIFEDFLNSGLDFKIFGKLFSICQRYEAKKQELDYLRNK